MAKDFTVKKEEYAYPSRFGSHKSMVIAEKEDGTVVCHDEFGDYITLKNRVDNGSSDPNRYTESRISGLLGGNNYDHVYDPETGEIKSTRKEVKKK